MQGKNGEVGGQLFKNKQEIELQVIETQEQSYKTENMFEQQFQQEELVQTKEEEKTKEAQEAELANSFKTVEADQVKTDADEPQEPAPAFVSLSYSGVTITKNDDKKMKAVKSAIQNYQKSRGTDGEADSLLAVIKACNSYTWGKFSLFSFGKSKVKLNEVKKVREDALMALEILKVNAIQKTAGTKEPTEPEPEPESVQTDESTLAPQVEIVNKEVADPDDWTSAGMEKQVAKLSDEVRKKYPGMSEKNVERIAKKEFWAGNRFSDDRVLDIIGDGDFADYHLILPQVKERKKKEAEAAKKAAEAAQKAKEREEREKAFSSSGIGDGSYEDIMAAVEKDIQSRLNDMNAAKRFFTKLFGMTALKVSVLEYKLKEVKFAFGVEDKTKTLSKNDSDYESTFI